MERITKTILIIINLFKIKSTMKKIMTLAAMFAAVAMTFSACNKEQKPDNGGNEGGNNTEQTCPDCGENPCVCEPEYEAPITIDGDFSDWDSVNAAVAYCDPEAKYTALSTFKCYADDVYVFVYFEFVEDEIGHMFLSMYISMLTEATQPEVLVTSGLTLTASGILRA